MLAMMYFVRRLSAAGGVLCVDEPEQHLHPTLQASLFESMQHLADRAQVLVVSHSVNLIAASPLSGLVQVAAPTNSTANQIRRLADQPDRVELVATLGVTPADLFQSDILLVVEGDTDSQWLRSLFPVELGRAHVMIAGSGQQVLDAHETLEKVPAGLPWVCLRDRDLLGEEAVHRLGERYANLRIWPRRAIENMFLDAPLVVSVMQSVGKSVSVDEVDQLLNDIATPLRNEVLAGLVEQELSREFPAPEMGANGSRHQRMEQRLRDYAAVNIRRAEALQATADRMCVTLDARWESEWVTLVDPKPVLAELTRKLGVFKSRADLMSALVARSREDASVRPRALEELRLHLASMLTQT